MLWTDMIINGTCLGLCEDFQKLHFKIGTEVFVLLI